MGVRGRDYYGLEYYRISSLPCCICGHRGWWAHHVKSVGSGGLDKGNLVPLCVEHHTEVEKGGRKTFENRYGVSLQEMAKTFVVIPEMAEEEDGAGIGGEAPD